MITTEQQLLCEKLYKQGKLTIKQIMAETGIRSEQTVYRILDAANIPRRPNRATVLKKTISFDRVTSSFRCCICSPSPDNIHARLYWGYTDRIFWHNR